jgi:hypothetical protein
MLKLCPNKIALPLQIIFNKSLQQSKYPKNWKLAHVIAVFKKGNSSLPSNYRPISLEKSQTQNNLLPYSPMNLKCYYTFLITDVLLNAWEENRIDIHI